MGFEPGQWDFGKNGWEMRLLPSIQNPINVFRLQPLFVAFISAVRTTDIILSPIANVVHICPTLDIVGCYIMKS